MSTISRVSTAQRYESLLQAMQQNKADIAKAEGEIATGLKSDIYADPAGRSGLSVDLRNKLEVTNTYLVANVITAERQDSAATLLNSIGEQALAVRDLLLQSDSWRSDPTVLKDTARAALENIVTAMNTTYGGIFLFSGRATDTAPYVADGNGGYVYQGDTAGQFTAPMADGQSITVAPRGDSPAIAASVAWLGQLANTDFSTLDDAGFSTLINTALTDLTKHYDGITVLEGSHGNNQSRLETTVKTQTALVLSYNNTIVAIEGVEPEEAAVRLKSAQTQLESTYAITAQLSRLSLLNYL